MTRGYRKKVKLPVLGRKVLNLKDREKKRERNNLDMVING